MKTIFIITSILLLTSLIVLGVGTINKYIDLSKASTTRDLKEKIPFITNNKQKILPKKLSHNKIINHNIVNATTEIKKDTLSDKSNNEITNLKTTPLKLKLLGTITGGNQEEAYAVIEDIKKNEQALYQVGQVVQGATVIKILRQKVILNINNENQVLEINFLPSSKVKSNPNPNPNLTTEKSDQKPPEFITVNLARSAIDFSTNNIEQLTQQATIKPHFKNGEIEGLLFLEIKQGSLFSKMKIQNGDIITSYNNKKLVSVDDAVKLFKTLINSSDTILTIRRDSSIEEISYHVR